MKFYKSLLSILVVAALLTITHCGPKDKDDTPPDQIQEQVNLFVANWTLVADGAILGTVPNSDYNTLTLSVTGNKDGGTATTNISSLSGTTSTDVWPATSTWQFSSSNGDVSNPAAQYVLRESDGVVIGLAEVTNTTLQLTFTIGSAGSAREMGIDGDWTFNFTRQ